jgi:AraC-like DNA-binding protein
MQWRSVDARCITAVESGDAHLLKATEHCALHTFDANGEPGSAHCGDTPFSANCIVVTLDGTWEVRTPAGASRVDRGRAVVGEGGELCPGTIRTGRTRRLLLTLDPSGLDPGVHLFDDTIVEAHDVARLADRARFSACDDAFDTMIFSAFDEASSASLGRRQRDSRIRMQRLKRFIEAHAFEPITLQSMAVEMGLSPFSMIRMFRAAAGTTPYAYLLDIRFERACHLLRRGSRPIAEVAQVTGFSQHSHFTRWFIRRSGVSPSAFRER